MSIAYKILTYSLKVLWLICCVYFYLQFHWSKANWQESEVVELFNYKMLLLTLPAGYVASLIAGVAMDLLSLLLQRIFGNQPVSLGLYYTVIWGAMTFAGYAQWFVYLPRIIKRGKPPSLE